MLVFIEKFIKQGNTNNLKQVHILGAERTSKLKCFGQGVPVRIPWIGLLKSPNTIQKGFIRFLYYQEFNKLVLSYGVKLMKANSNGIIPKTLQL
jgi:hypothetical protein